MATEAIAESESGLPYGGINGTLAVFDREALITLLSGAIDSLRFKVEKGRIRDIKNEKLRLEQLRVLFYGCSVANAVLKEKEALEIEKRIEALEHVFKSRKQ
jgi:hypothetical protein